MLARIASFKRFHRAESHRRQPMLARDVDERVYGQLPELALRLDRHRTTAALLDVLPTGSVPLGSIMALTCDPITAS